MLTGIRNINISLTLSKHALTWFI